MKRVKIYRIARDGGTYGVLTIDGVATCVTLERPWVGNRPDVSCIPIGTYLCKWTRSPHHGNTFEVTNVPGRSHILFHVGNYINDSKGCILLGTYFSTGGILRSNAAFLDFLAKMEDADFELQIVDVMDVRPRGDMP